MVFIPSALSFLAVAGPTQNSSFTGSGHIFLSISQVNRVWTWSGFWNSEAILASSLLSDTPMFTVKPSSRRISSFSWCANAVCVPHNPIVPSTWQNASSILYW